MNWPQDGGQGAGQREGGIAGWGLGGPEGAPMSALRLL